jgi:hypothetical protein
MADRVRQARDVSTVSVRMTRPGPVMAGRTSILRFGLGLLGPNRGPTRLLRPPLEVAGARIYFSYGLQRGYKAHATALYDAR